MEKRGLDGVSLMSLIDFWYAMRFKKVKPGVEKPFSKLGLIRKPIIPGETVCSP